MSNKAIIPSFPAFFKDKKYEIYMALFSNTEIINVSTIGFTDGVRRDSYTIDVIPDEDHMRSLVPISEEEFGAAMDKAHCLQKEWYEKQLSITQNKPSEIKTLSS